MNRRSQDATADQTGRVRVLVAESDSRLRSLLSWLLTEDPRFLVTAQVGDASELAATKGDFDVALVDLNLSGSVGLAPISALSQRVPAPVVVVLADVGPVYLRHAAAAEGASGFLLRSSELENLPDELFKLSRTMVSPR